MQNNTGRHRKPSATRVIARRTAVSTGAAVAAVLVSAGGATAATASSPANVPPISCTGSPLDAFTTCATGGHSQRGGDRGDAVGGDTPSLGGGGGGQ